MAGWETSKRAVRSFTAASPRVSDSKIALRVRSPRAWKILSSAATALMPPSISDYLYVVKHTSGGMAALWRDHGCRWVRSASADDERRLQVTVAGIRHGDEAVRAGGHPGPVLAADHQRPFLREPGPGAQLPVRHDPGAAILRRWERDPLAAPVDRGERETTGAAAEHDQFGAGVLVGERGDGFARRGDRLRLNREGHAQPTVGQHGRRRAET